MLDVHYVGDACMGDVRTYLNLINGGGDTLVAAIPTPPICAFIRFLGVYIHNQSHTYRHNVKGLIEYSTCTCLLPSDDNAG